MRASLHSLVRSFLITMALLLAAAGSAQNFSGINYQAVVRTVTGDPMPFVTVAVRVHIHPGLESGYSERHVVTTDARGLITLVMGMGEPEQSSVVPSFADLDWSSGDAMSYSISLDITGSYNYLEFAAGTFTTVPFALHALTSDSTAASVPQTLSLSNDTLYISGGNGVDLSGLRGEASWVVSGDTLHNEGKRVGVGTTAPETTLHVVGGFKYQDGNQSAGRLLTSDAQGHASWQTPSAASLLGTGELPSDNLCTGLLATTSTGTNPWGLTISGNYAYVVNGGSGTLEVFDVSNPAAPSLSGSALVGQTAYSVAVSGDHAYVVNSFFNNLKVLNVSNPAAPTLSATISTATTPLSVAVSGNYAYVVSYGSNMMQVYNISDPAAPSVSSSALTGAGPVCVAVSGSYAYVLNRNASSMQVFDVSNPGAPGVSATITTGSSPEWLALSGSYAYVVTNSGELQVFDVSDPAAPTLSATISTGINAVSVAVSGNYAYVVGILSNNLQVVNVSNPAAPALIATVPTGQGPRSVAVSDDHAIVLGEPNRELQVFTIFCEQELGIDPSTGALTATTSLWDTFGADIASTNTGHVGIGTNTPTSKLHLKSDLAMITLEDANDSTRLLLLAPDLTGGGTGGLGVDGYGDLPLFTNGQDRITIKGDGKVGIGTSTPESALDLHGGNLRVTGDGLSAAVDLTPFSPGSNDPGARVQATDDGGFGAHLDFLVKPIGSVTNTLENRMRIMSSGNVGIGTTTPENKLDVEGGLAVGTSYSGSNVAPANGAIIQGNVGIGTTAPTAMLEVQGNVLLTGGASQFNATADNTSGNASFGDVVYSDTKLNATSDQDFTFYAENTTGSGSGNFAGYFSGNVEVSGTLAKGGGSFKIDHPLDPANKFLYHSFVESPDMMNVYNGNATLDGSGSATITLPDYFQALNKDFRYQLTAIGAPGPGLYVAQEVNNNSFVIAGGTPGGKVSWQVTGIRKDAFAEQNRIPNSVDKKGAEVGRYMHPEAFGLDRSMRIDLRTPATSRTGK